VNPHHDSPPPSRLTAGGEPRDVREVREMHEPDHDADKVDAVAGSEFGDDLIRLRDDDQGV
jgi:hypothetical protein